MAKSCSIIPQVRNNKGQIVDSRLFKDLLAFSGDRKETNRIYYITKGEEFIQKWFPKLVIDENNEPTIRSLFKFTNLKTYIPENKIVEKLNRDIGHYKKGMERIAYWPDDETTYNKLVKRVGDFNRNSDFSDEYYARVDRVQDPESHRIFLNPTIYKRNKNYSLEENKINYNEELNKKLRSILESKGVSVGVLNDLEKRLGISGVADFDSAKVTAEGLIELIRLAEGKKGEKALPEEFAHFVIEAMGAGNHPLINRLLNVLNNDEIIQNVLGEEYNKYVELYGNDRLTLVKEVAGKLLAKHLLNEYSIPKAPYSSILRRVIEAIKNFFSKFNKSQIKDAMIEADKEVGRLAKDILSGKIDDEINIKNISSSDKFFQVSERVERDLNILRKIIETEAKRLNIYKTRNPNSRFEATQTEFLKKLTKDLKEKRELEGIFSYLDNTLKELGKVSKRLEALREDTDSGLNKKAYVLRDVRNYLFSYSSTLEDIREALIEEEDLNDNRYGERTRVLINEVSNLLDDLFINYEKIANPIFLEFLRQYVGDSVTIKGKEVKLSDLIKKADKDISIFDRYLDSMADSSDDVLKIMDKIVKNSKEQARLSTIEVKKELEAAKIKLEQAGIKDTEWMFEKDDNGNFTGNYISDLSRLNNAQKEYYNTVMSIKRKLDSYIPGKYTKPLNTIKIRKDLLERIKSSKDVKSGVKQLWESVKDEIVKRSDDEEFGSKAILMDFEGNQVQTLPIYYTSLKEGESNNDISTDITSTMTAYASMAIDYSEMNKVIHSLELGRDVLRKRKIKQVSGNKVKAEVYKILGKKVENPLIKEGDATYFMTRLNDFFDMQVYGRYIKDEGNITIAGKDTKISKAKAANLINKITSINTMAGNVLLGISSILTGKVMMRIEAVAGEFFNYKNVVEADKIYRKYLTEYLGEIGSRVKTNKLALWGEYFNTMQNYESSVRDLNFDRKSIASKLFSLKTAYFLSNAGEHWMQNRTSLALASNYKMKTPNGKIVNLWDAMEVVYKDPNNKKLGATLQIKQGYTKEDGTEFTKEDAIAFSLKSAAINQRMHGIYNKADKNAIQKVALGRLAYLYRNWIKPSLNRRFASRGHNYMLDTETEGYYITAVKFIWALIQDLRQAKFDIVARWDDFTEDKTNLANLKRAITEIANFAVVALVVGIFDWTDDDEEDEWFVNILEYQSRRLYTELGALVPLPLTMLPEGLKILESPAASINTIENALNLLKLFDYTNYFDEIESGKYKGHSTARKLLLESPLVPMYKTVNKIIHPETMISYFKY